MSTWQQLINLFMKDSGVLGVGQTLQAEDTNDAKLRLNMTLSQWKRQRWLVFHLVDHVIPMDGSLFYTMGAAGDLNVPRTDSIESAFVRQVIQSQPNQVDYPLRIVQSYEEYSTISLKQLSAGPGYILFYDSGFPLGKLYPWPLMNSQYELHIQVKDELVTVGALNAEILLPPEYELALYAEMMKRTRSAYRLPPDPEINALAKHSKDVLKSSNFQIPTLSMPSSVQGRGAYNIWGDRFGYQGR